LYRFVIGHGFNSAAGHPCLFIRIAVVGGQVCVIVIGIFVNDLQETLFAEMTEVRERIIQRFILLDQGELECYLGVEISSLDENSLLLHQTAYAKKILNNFKMNDCNPAKTPLPRDTNISLLHSSDEVDHKLKSEYRAIVGSFMYLYQWTRPDIGFAVTIFSRYLHKSGEKHLQAAKHVLRYLKGTWNQIHERYGTTQEKGTKD
jgi:hypothetical protein